MKSRRPFALLLAGVIIGAAATLAGIYWGMPSSAQEINIALKTTQIASVSFKDTPYEDAAREVLKQVHAACPDFRGVRLQSLKPHPSFDAKVTCEFENTRAEEVLRFVLNNAGGDYLVSDGSIQLIVLYGGYGTPPLSAKEELAEKVKDFFR